jgi:hypothetical protein
MAQNKVCVPTAEHALGSAHAIQMFGRAHELIRVAGNDNATGVGPRRMNAMRHD